jgi:hypothetical protein
MVSGEAGDEAMFWTYDAVEERLVETVRCWWRMPGGGGWPFASDGPWHLIRKEWEDWDARDPKPLRRMPLSRAEMRDMAEATEWLTWIGDDGQRRALVGGLLDRAKGRKRIGWEALRERLGEPELTGAAIQYRYSRAVTFIANVLNAMSGMPFVSRGGVRARYPKDVLAFVARKKDEAFQPRNMSTPGM